MIGRIRAKLSYSNVVATIALFLVVGGGAAVAAGLGRNDVRSRHIAPNQVKGVDAEESSFAKVPSAAHADSATRANSASNAESAARADSASNAAALGGTPPSGFFSSSNVVQVNRVIDSTARVFHEEELFSMAGFTVTGGCTRFGAGVDGTVYLWVNAAPTGAITNYSYIRGPGNPGEPVNGGFHGTGTILDFAGPKSAAGVVILRSPSSVISLNFHVHSNASGTCEVFGTALRS